MIFYWILVITQHFDFILETQNVKIDIPFLPFPKPDPRFTDSISTPRITHTSRSSKVFAMKDQPS